MSHIQLRRCAHTLPVLARSLSRPSFVADPDSSAFPPPGAANVEHQERRAPSRTTTAAEANYGQTGVAVQAHPAGAAESLSSKGDEQ